MSDKARESTNPDAGISELQDQLKRSPVSPASVARAVEVDPRENDAAAGMESKFLSRERAAREEQAPPESSAEKTGSDATGDGEQAPHINTLPPPD